MTSQLVCAPVQTTTPIAAAATARGPLLKTGTRGPSPRVAVLTGSYGAGHNSAAHELAVRLRDRGADIEIHDIVDLLPWHLGPVLRTAYYTQLRRLPGSWATTLQILKPGRPLHRAATRLLGLAARSVAAATAHCDLVITTHPFGAQALGHARAAGRLGCPAVTYFTDASVHSVWVHPAIDLNLAIHQVAADDAHQWGAAATVVKPLVPTLASRKDHQHRPDPLASLTVVGSRALVAGGSMGMGDLENTCRDIVATGLMTPVALCGTDATLRRRLERIPGVVALGWRDDLPALMATSACVVQNAGGFTSLEALASGTPVITYRPIPGHGEANAINLEKAGLVPWAHTLDELALLLAAATSAPRVDRLETDAPDAVTVLAGQHPHAAVA